MNILLDLAVGGALGVILVVGFKAGWARIKAWAHGVKPDYSRIAGDPEIAGGIIGGMASRATARERMRDDDEASLIQHSRHLQQRVDQLTEEKSFAQQLTEQKTFEQTPPFRR